MTRRSDGTGDGTGLVAALKALDRDAVLRYLEHKSADELWTPEALLGSAALIDELLVAARPVVATADSGLEVISARDLLQKKIPPLVETVPGLIVEGLGMLVGGPKKGKSWLAYQVAVAVATGGQVLGRRALKGDALYLALEDGERRAQDRIGQILRHTGHSHWPLDAAQLDVAFNADRGDEMVEQVEGWIAARDGRPGLVIIDTLQKVRPAPRGRPNQYALDVDDVGRVQRIAQRHSGLAVVVVHHDRKERGDDFLDAASGTHGITGSVDTVLVLKRPRHERKGTLEVTGRDVREGLLHIVYDDPLWTVDPLGGLTAEQIEAWEWLRDHGPAGAKAVGDALGRERTATQKLLDRMAEGASLVKDDRGRFAVPARINYVTNRTGGTDGTGVTDGTHVTHVTGDDERASETGGNGVP